MRWFCFLKSQYVQSHIFIEDPVGGPVDDADDEFAGGADVSLVQVSAENFTFFVAGAHVKVGIVFTVHGVNGTGKRNNLKKALKMVGKSSLLKNVYNNCSKVS